MKVYGKWDSCPQVLGIPNGWKDYTLYITEDRGLSMVTRMYGVRFGDVLMPTKYLTREK